MLRFNRDSQTLEELRVSSLEVATSASKMSSYANRTLDHALTLDQGLGSASTATHEISDNLTQISSAAQDFSKSLQDIRVRTQNSITNITTVTEATRELADTSNAIATNTERAAQTAQEAVQGVDAALNQVSGLEEAAHEISKLTQVIHDISEQTKVLALNATIEAAREAAAGRGFAVVAREVKDLAAETREATNYIREKVTTIEETIATTIGAIKSVSNVIGDVNDVVASIATAATQQSASTASIAENADSAQVNFKEIYDSIYDGSLAMDGVAERIGAAAARSESVSLSVDEMAKASHGIAEEATASFARSLEIDERVGDMLWQFETMGLDVDLETFEPRPDMFRMSPRYSVFTLSMDKEHEKIFGFVNDVHECFKHGSSDEDLKRVFGELAAYTTEHFADEEALMLKHDYPDFDDHKRAHEKLLNTVTGFLQDLESGEKVNPAAALNMLIHWLKEHIKHVDRKYGLYYQEKGIKV